MWADINRFVLYGKVENTHATLYDILRTMVTRWGDNWAEHLPMAEFAFNSIVCSSTGVTPFEVAYGRRPAFPRDLRGPRSDMPRAEAAATRVIALTTACRDHFEAAQWDNQTRVTRRREVPVRVGELVLLSTKNLVSLKSKTACARLSSRFTGLFRVVNPPEDEPVNHGQSKNYVWLALPATLGDIWQPINLSRLRRFHDRPSHPEGRPFVPPNLERAADWGKHCGTPLDKIGATALAEFCVGHEMQLTLPADYYPPDHHTHPYTGPRKVRVFDSFSDRSTPLQVAVYLLDLPLDDDPNRLEYETSMIPVFAPRYTPAARQWTLMPALEATYPGAVYLKDLLPNADSTVVYKNTQMPIYQVVASQLARRGGHELLVQFVKGDFADSAWIPERFVPTRYLDEFWERVDPDEPPDPGND